MKIAFVINFVLLTVAMNNILLVTLSLSSILLTGENTVAMKIALYLYSYSDYCICTRILITVYS